MNENAKKIRRKVTILQGGTGLESKLQQESLREQSRRGERKLRGNPTKNLVAPPLNCPRIWKIQNWNKSNSSKFKEKYKKNVNTKHFLRLKL